MKPLDVVLALYQMAYEQSQVEHPGVAADHLRPREWLRAGDHVAVRTHQVGSIELFLLAGDQVQAYRHVADPAPDQPLASPALHLWPQQ